MSIVPYGNWMEIEYMLYFFIQKEKTTALQVHSLPLSNLKLGFGFNYGIKQEFWFRDFTSRNTLKICSNLTSNL